jgi:hypothetical protein
VARRPIESRLLDLMENDPRAAAIPPDAAFVWLRLGRLIARFGGLDTFRFGPGLRSVTDLAAWFRLSVTEVETTIETLVRMGALIALEGEGYAFPDWVGLASRKALTARENGRKHRPQAKSEAPESLVPGQRRLPLMAAIPGGRASVTQPTTTTTQDSGSQVVVSPSAATLAPEDEVLAWEIGRSAGMADSKIRRTLRCVGEWRNAGASPDLIREVASKVLHRPEPPPKGFRSLRYFDDAIRDQLTARAQPAVVPLAKPESDPIEEAGRRAWSAQLEAWRQGGCIGPMPPRLEDFIERARAVA